MRQSASVCACASRFRRLPRYGRARKGAQRRKPKLPRKLAELEPKIARAKIAKEGLNTKYMHGEVGGAHYYPYHARPHSSPQQSGEGTSFVAVTAPFPMRRVIGMTVTKYGNNASFAAATTPSAQSKCGSWLCRVEAWKIHEGNGGAWTCGVEA